MSDAEAVVEARRSIEFVREACTERNITLTIRLNPMYLAEGTEWGRHAAADGYEPPLLTDAIELATSMRASGLPVYLGLTSEGLSDLENTFRGRREFSTSLLKSAITLNGSPGARLAQRD